MCNCFNGGRSRSSCNSISANEIREAIRTAEAAACNAERIVRNADSSVCAAKEAAREAAECARAAEAAKDRMLYMLEQMNGNDNCHSDSHEPDCGCDYRY